MATEFEKLAKKRGVDLPAERARGREQIARGETIKGTTPSSQRGIAAARGGGRAKEVFVPPESIVTAPTPTRTFTQLAIDPYAQGRNITEFTTDISSPKQNAIIEFWKDRTRLELAALGFIEPPEGIQITAAAVFNPFGPLASSPAAARQAVKLTNIPAMVAKAKKGTGVLWNTFNTRLRTRGATRVAGMTRWQKIGSIGIAVLIADKILELTLGGKNFGEFVGMEEASQSIGIVATSAIFAGEYDIYDDMTAARWEVISNDTYWENINTYVPYSNLGTDLERYRQTLITASLGQDELVRRLREKEANGDDDKTYWENVKKAEAEQDKAAVDYYNSERKKMFLFEQEAKTAANKAQRKADKQFYREQAQYWTNQRDLQREKEEEDRRAIAAFWLDYRKRQQQMFDDNRPSKLRFGII